MNIKLHDYNIYTVYTYQIYIYIYSFPQQESGISKRKFGYPWECTLVIVPKILPEQMAQRFKQSPLCEGTQYVINLVVCRCAVKR